MPGRTALLRLVNKALILPLLALLALGNSASTPQRYTLDASASNVSAKVPFFGLASKTARFPRMQGAVTIVPGAPDRAVIDVTFDATAIEAPDEVTLARLRGEKFFWVEKYPTIRFLGRSLDLKSPTRGTVTGELTARGVTRPALLEVTFDGDPLVQTGRPVSFIGTTTIDRRQFGMKSYQLIVGNQVDITLKARMVPR
jgi:polyisoprenoid-binding protein YceI